LSRLAAFALAVAAVAMLAAGCGGGEGRVRVLAAASLTDVLPEVDPGPQYSFAGSSELATQIREGAPADVYVSADPRLARSLAREGLAGDVADFGGNRLVILVPSDNPASIRAAADLDRPGLRLVLAQAGVPVGDYARQALRRLGLTGALERVVSEERDARAVAGKLALGEVDAGIAYATDAEALGARVQAIDLPAAAQPRIRYAVAILRDGPAARAFVERLLGARGREALGAAGFAGP